MCPGQAGHAQDTQHVKPRPIGPSQTLQGQEVLACSHSADCVGEAVLLGSGGWRRVCRPVSDVALPLGSLHRAEHESMCFWSFPC